MMMRFATRNDLPAIVDVHLRAFDTFFMTQLGPWFLYEYYRAVLEYPAGIVLVASSRETDAIQGFAAGFLNPTAFYRCLRSRRARLALATLPQLLRRPALVPGLLANSRRVNQYSQQGYQANDSELASIAVAPSAQGTGVGTRLAQAFLCRSCEFGATRVLLTTDAEENASVNQFYLSLGFRVCECFELRQDRRMYRYEFVVSADHPALGAVSDAA
jgi:ribosomal protein S18 acetylase RimI-like enzyme